MKIRVECNYTKQGVYTVKILASVRIIWGGQGQSGLGY